MFTANSPCVPCETDRLFALLSRLDTYSLAEDVFIDIREIRRLLSLYSFHSPQHADRLCAKLSSRYRQEVLCLYGSAFLRHPQSENPYLRLEQLVSLLVRVAAQRLCIAGLLSLSSSQLTLSDGLLLRLIEKEAQQKTGS